MAFGAAQCWSLTPISQGMLSVGILEPFLTCMIDMKSRVSVIIRVHPAS